MERLRHQRLLVSPARSKVRSPCSACRTASGVAPAATTCTKRVGPLILSAFPFPGAKCCGDTESGGGADEVTEEVDEEEQHRQLKRERLRALRAAHRRIGARFEMRRWGVAFQTSSGLPGVLRKASLHF